MFSSSHDLGRGTLTTKRHRTSENFQHRTVTVGRDLWVSTSLQSLEECLTWVSLCYGHISVSDCSVIRAKHTTNPLDDQMPPTPGESHSDRAKRLRLQSYHLPRDRGPGAFGANVS